MTERPGAVKFKGTPMTLLGPEIKVGDQAPDFKLVGNDLADIECESFHGNVRVLSVAPSIDTPVCATQTRTFNKEAAGLAEDVVILSDANVHAFQLQHLNWFKRGVEEAGMGLTMVGGDETFGGSGPHPSWGPTSVGEILPVDCIDGLHPKDVMLIVSVQRPEHELVTSLPLSEGAYGFDAGVYYASSFPSESKLAGFACAPEAIAMASGKLDFSAIEGQLMLSEQLVLDKIGLTIFYNVWGDPSSRSLIGSFEVMFGAEKAIVDGTIASVYNP